jgi:hypothetical protein
MLRIITMEMIYIWKIISCNFQVNHVIIATGYYRVLRGEVSHTFQHVIFELKLDSSGTLVSY